ncbi:MAG: hypothetical protein J6P02_03530 [Lachnospiraceae bacterium]|nr:hypothetical protein [Lachnospiraceae bacterium]
MEDVFAHIKNIETKEEMAKFLSDAIYIIFKCSLTKRKFYEETLKKLSERIVFIDPNKEYENLKEMLEKEKK